MSNFFKSSAFVKSFFVFGAAFFATLSISCKQLASFDPVVNGEQTVVSGGTTSETAEFAFNLKATHGLVRKISLEWTAFSGAKYYEIYFAESSSAEFAKIGETEQPFFDDAVGAGRTGYFKVCAVKANGASSPFSSTVVGTSLAVPIISDGEVGESEANISWSMENARGIDGTDYYEKTLKFEVVCQPKGGSDGETKVLSASSFSGSSYSCKFENLSSSQDYEFYIEAYLEGDTQSREKSPTVDKTTLTAYTPLAPKFTASEGDNAKGISLLITLPEMVTVKTFVKDSENPNEKQDVLYPLCFEIYRKHEKAETYPQDSVRALYYDGQNLTTNSVEYQEAGAPYEAGKQVVWFDDDASLIGGEKYDYMIRSFVDFAYDKEVCPEDKQNKKEELERKGTPIDKATTAQGWKSAPPSFNVKIGDDSRKLSADNKEILSISFGFSAEWNDLGKAGDYKFAINRNHTPWNGGSGTDTLLKNGETIYFETLDEINSRVETFGSESGGLKPEVEGSYSYTLYIVSKNDTGTEKIENETNVLDTMTARDKVVVTKEVNLPKAELKAEGGYKDKVILEIPSCEPNVTYTLERAELVDEKPTNEKTIDLSVPASGVFKYEDKVDGNHKYSYVLKAKAASGVFTLSKSQVAETLGTPDVSFKKDKLNYDSVTISFDGVLAAKKYIVKLGDGGGFGGGKIFQFDSGFAGATGNAEVSLEGKTYTVTIKGPEGYDNARLAGTKANVTVTAHSGNDNAPSDPKPVNVLGPALLEAKVDSAKATGESISLTWKAVDGAKGYLIRRVMYSDAGMTKVAEGSDVTYYYEVASRTITTDVDSEAIGERAIVADSDAGFTLTDKYMEITTKDETLKEYQEKQAKIAWGLPFRYVVLPVLGKDDFSFDELKLADDGKVAYTNLAPTATTATFGYGLNLVAEKAMSGTVQGITWDVPNKLNETQTAIYRRMYTTSNGKEDERENKFVRITNFSSKDTGTGATILVENDNLCNAFEYIVKYYEKGVTPDSDIKLPDSLFEEVAKQTEEPRKTSKGEKIEQKNKGYLLAVDLKTSPHPNLDSKPEYTYAEQISWTPWDYNIRAVGPETMELTMRNYNIDSEEHGVFLITVDKTTGKISVDLKEIDNDTEVEEADFASAYNVKSKALVAKKETASGMLKVLRDLPHYTLTLKNGEETVSYEKSARRHITCEELVRSATLAIAYGIQQTGPDWTTTLTERTTPYNEAYPGSGSAIVKSVGGTTVFVSLSHDFTFTNFTPAMPTRAGEKATFLTINGAMSGTTGGGGSTGQSYAPKTYTNGSFTVKSAEDDKLYKATITISSLTVNGTSGLKINYSDGGGEKEFGNITPFTFGNGNKKYSANPLAEGKAEWQ